jgi:hypothetical protein
MAIHGEEIDAYKVPAVDAKITQVNLLVKLSECFLSNFPSILFNRVLYPSAYKVYFIFLA